MSEERIRILEMISQGVITAEEGWGLIHALGDNLDEEDTHNQPPTPEIEPEPLEVVPTPVETTSSSEQPVHNFEVPDFAKFQRWWIWPFLFTTVITGLFILLLVNANQADWAGFWIFCVWNFVIFGAVLMLISLLSSSSRWVHVRVHTGQDEWPRRIAISLPLPIRLLAVLVRIVRPFISEVRDLPVEDLVMAIHHGTSPENPIYIEVDEGRGNEYVQVYIG